jgi:chemotaxis signal transduction protein/nucleoid-associated protein YgaU
MAGMAVIDDRGATVFDLGACLGAAPLTSAERSRILLMKRQDQLFGFAVTGTIETFPVQDEQVIELPGTVRTPVVARGVVRNDVIMPIIEVRSLLDRLEQGELSVPLPEGPVMQTAEKQQARDRLRVLLLGGERYCIQGEGTSWVDAAGLRITALPYLRGPVAGIAYHDGAVVSVLASAGPLGSADAAAGASLLILERDGERYGILAEKDLGEVSGSELRPLPALARTAWSEEAVVQDGNIVLQLDLVKLIAPLASDESVPAQDAFYTPASDFSARFRQGSIAVMEFSLLGALHALPKDEVKEVFPPVPFRPVPGLPEIVLGVAERGRKILPVLDLATIFGRRTAAGSRARMLRIVNGDFQAIVLVEEAGDGRILEREVQRQVPIALPHPVLYGCYLDERAVRLIMNVHALAVHFERTEIRDLMASFAPPVIDQPAESTPQETVPPMPAEARARPAVPSSSSTAVRYDRSRDAMMAADRRREQEEQERKAAEEAEREAARRREEETRRQLEQEREKEAEAARRREEDAARAKAAEQEADAARADAERKAAEEERARVEDAARVRAEAEAKVRAEAEERERAAAKERAAAEERERIAAAEREKQAREEERIRQEQQRQAAEQAARDETKKRLEEAARAEAARQAEEQARHEREQEHERERIAEEQERRRTEERLRQAAAREMRDQAPASGMIREPGAAEPSRRPVRSRKALSIAAVVAALLVLLLYWAGGPSKDEQPVPERPQAPKVSSAVTEPEAPLVLDVPKTQPVPDMIVYTVVKGDTLWGISKRFTGDPFNYPRVAKDNSIATPDLIFPGQRIRLRHELQEQSEGKAKSP